MIFFNRYNSIFSDTDSVIYVDLRAKNIISDGTIPKMDNAFAALDAGVNSVVIGHADYFSELIPFEKRTKISR